MEKYIYVLSRSQVLKIKQLLSNVQYYGWTKVAYKKTCISYIRFLDKCLLNISILATATSSKYSDSPLLFYYLHRLLVIFRNQYI